MKLTTKGRYGLKAMFDLALNSNGEPIKLNAIGERQGISVNYLEQLISPLRKAGLVKSVRGAQGGYILAKPASEITVRDILVTLEGPIVPVDCVSEDDDENLCTHSDCCVSRIIYEKIRDSINEVVASITLQDMIDDHKQINATNIQVNCKN
ncbi:MAG: Rrf2 family transcriptional regulator [Clostridia bacterium]|nr:Rrf2 family transcriptional regulator [Clostridia bacterium]